MIGAINGPAVGVGVTMTLPMDIRLASDSAKFGFVFARRGIVPEACSSWFLPRVVGISQAAEWCYTGRVFPAAEALDGGLVRSVHAPDDLLPAARAIATRDRRQHRAGVSVALTRQMLWRMLGADHPMEAHRVDSRGHPRARPQRRRPRGRGQLPREAAGRVPADRSATDLPDIFPDWRGARLLVTRSSSAYRQVLVKFVSLGADVTLATATKGTRSRETFGCTRQSKGRKS